MGLIEDTLMQMIQDRSGLTVNDSHRKFLEHYIKLRTKKLGISDEEFLVLTQSSQEEFAALLNEAAINETYFFREERQFDFLQKHILTNLKDKEAVVWSAACSTGEEALSLYALFSFYGIKSRIYASDIDTAAMDVLRSGNYPKHSLRNDGKKFHKLLEAIGTITDNGVSIKKEVLNDIRLSSYNLISKENFPLAQGSVDILFIRNVFIYFTPQVRNEIIKNMVKALKTGGLLFLSVNEIASVDCEETIPLIKENYKGIYYFRKVSDEEKKNFCENKPKALPVRRLPAVDIPLLPHKEKKLLRHNTVHTPLQKKKIPEENKKDIPDFTEENTLNNLIDKFLSLMDKRNFSLAEKTVNDFVFKPNQIEYKLYMLGLIKKEEGQLKEAEQFFFQSSVSNPSFWPASFQEGLIYEKTGCRKKSKKAFENCMKTLEKYIQKNEICYNKLMQAFSPSYFLQLCRLYIAKED